MTFPFNEYSYSLFKWAAINKAARVFAYPNPRESDASIAFVPLADLLNHNDANFCNHNHKTSMFYFNQTSLSFDVKANQHYQEGDQLFICYNPHSNYDLMRVYGFSMVNNQYNSVTLKWPRVDLGESVWEEASIILRHDEAKMRAAIDEMLLDRVLAVKYCRSVSKSHQFWNASTCKAALLGIIHLQLATYPTSLEDDLDLLKGGQDSMSRNMQSAVHSIHFSSYWSFLFSDFYVFFL